MEFSANKNRVSKYFNLPALNQTEREKTLESQDKEFTNTIQMANRTYIFGIEVEVENVQGIRVLYNHQPYWEITADNSLRNHGAEFVSCPLKATQLEAAIHQLNTSLSGYKYDFSPRTSVHVHMNVRDLTMDQITALLLLYTTVENLLFRWVGKERDKNVFCIKLTETDYVKSFLGLSNDPQSTVHYWNKYTALNLHPIESKGTVEFRHLAGTCDKNVILLWVNLLSCLKTYAKNIGSLTFLLEQIYALNSNSEYETFLFNIFGEYTKELVWQDTDKLMASAISYVKLATLDMEPQERVIPKTIEEALRRPTQQVDWEVFDTLVQPTQEVPAQTATMAQPATWGELPRAIVGGRPILTEAELDQIQRRNTAFRQENANTNQVPFYQRFQPRGNT